MGWVPSSNDWLHQNDWFNDTAHLVRIQSNVYEFNNDVEVKEYKSKYTKSSYQSTINGQSESSKQSTNNLYTVRGQLKFCNNIGPTSIPDGSTLTVSLVDANRMDASSSVELGKMVKSIQGYKFGDSISYEIKTDKRPPYGPNASVSLVLSLHLLGVIITSSC